jgi:hypothetical protein
MLLSSIVKALGLAALFAGLTTLVVYGQTARGGSGTSGSSGASANSGGGENNHIVLNTLAEELKRNFDTLKKKADPAPYFLSYEVTDQDTHTVSASLGVLNSSGASRNRYLDVTVRVGDPTLDNFRRVRGERVQFTSGTAVPIDDAAAPLRICGSRRTESTAPPRSG